MAGGHEIGSKDSVCRCRVGGGGHRHKCRKELFKNLNKVAFVEFMADTLISSAPIILQSLIFSDTKIETWKHSVAHALSQGHGQLGLSTQSVLGGWWT